MREDRKILYEYWQNLQTLKDFPAESEIKIIKQPIRDDILRILRNGIEEEINGQIYHRYVLSARELLIQINHDREEIVKKTNLYFHLKKLEDSGYICEVASYLEGNHKIKYFGRTAKLFTFSGNNKGSKFLTPLHQLLIRTNKLSESKINKLLDNMEERIEILDQATLDWIENNISLLDDLHIDLSILSSIFTFLTASDPKLSKLNLEVMDAIDLKIPD